MEKYRSIPAYQIFNVVGHYMVYCLDRQGKAQKRDEGGENIQLRKRK